MPSNQFTEGDRLNLESVLRKQCHTDALLQDAENLRDAAERKLATSTSLPTSKLEAVTAAVASAAPLP
jgi:hypothetical protein